MGAVTKGEEKLARRLDELHDEQDELMKSMRKLVQKWFASRKEQERVLKKLGWW